MAKVQHEAMVGF